APQVTAPEAPRRDLCVGLDGCEACGRDEEASPLRWSGNARVSVRLRTYFPALATSAARAQIDGQRQRHFGHWSATCRLPALGQYPDRAGVGHRLLLAASALDQTSQAAVACSSNLSQVVACMLGRASIRSSQLARLP